MGGAGKTQLRVTAPVSDEQALDNVWEMAHYCQFIDIILINISTLMFHWDFFFTEKHITQEFILIFKKSFIGELERLQSVLIIESAISSILTWSQPL